MTRPEGSAEILAGRGHGEGGSTSPWAVLTPGIGGTAGTVGSTGCVGTKGANGGNG
jgi:hypothetical protein